MPGLCGQTTCCVCENRPFVANADSATRCECISLVPALLLQKMLICSVEGSVGLWPSIIRMHLYPPIDSFGRVATMVRGYGTELPNRLKAGQLFLGEVRPDP